MKTGPEYPRFLGDDLPERAPEDCLFHILPVPLEHTVSYGTGTARGPRAIMEASLQLETYLDGEIPSEAGIYSHPPIKCQRRPLETILKQIGTLMAALVEQNKVPIILGGEHTVTYGPVRSLWEKGYRVGVVHFDAHADLRDSYQGVPWSHACVVRRIVDLGVPVFQIGGRSLSAAEADFRDRYRIPHLDAERLHRGTTQGVVLPEDFPDALYVTFDVDVFDSSLMPATGTPEPGGLSWYAIMDILDSVLKGQRVVAADFVELAPLPDWHACDFTVAKLVYAFMGKVLRARASTHDDPKLRRDGWNSTKSL